MRLYDAPKVFSVNSWSREYNLVVHDVLEGRSVSPRSLNCYEIHPALLVLHSPQYRILHVPHREINTAFMMVEALWILKGTNELAMLNHYCSNINQFSDDGINLRGAYGPRLRNWIGAHQLQEALDKNLGVVEITDYVKPQGVDQFQECFKLLKNDPDTRQAQMVIYDPGCDFVESKDIPCTTALQFLLREGRLDVSVIMRSNDIIWGTPYNIYNFTFIQEIMAGLLGVPVGRYFHFANSLHIYENMVSVVSAMDKCPYDTDDQGLLVDLNTCVDVGEYYTPTGFLTEEFVEEYCDKNSNYFNSELYDNIEDDLDLRAIVFWHALKQVYRSEIHTRNLTASEGLQRQEVSVEYIVDSLERSYIKFLPGRYWQDYMESLLFFSIMRHGAFKAGDEVFDYLIKRIARIRGSWKYDLMRVFYQCFTRFSSCREYEPYYKKFEDTLADNVDRVFIRYYIHGRDMG